MPNTPDVISAFLDDEPFDAKALAAALSEPSGREALIESIALRHLVQPDARAMRSFARQRPSPMRLLAAAAAVFLALFAGYSLGERRAATATAADTLPSPTRVVEAGAWQALPARSRQ